MSEYCDVNQTLLQSASALADACFGSNLLVSFIGGSRARESYRNSSDVDSFIVVRESNREQEKAYFHEFQQLHSSNQLLFSHCGEVFDKKTLEDLISYTIRVPDMMPEIRSAGCYYGDCLFSVFRKGVVVLGFLKDPKVFVSGDKKYLSDLESRAVIFMRSFTLDNLSLHSSHSTGNLSPIITYGNQVLEQNDLQDTPVGIGLERWFRYPFGEFHSQHSSLIEAIGHAKTVRSLNQRICPLQIDFADVMKEVLFKEQCLAIRSDPGNENAKLLTPLLR